MTNDESGFFKWLMGGMGSVILLLLGVGVADARGRLSKVDKLLIAHEGMQSMLGQIEKHIERVEVDFVKRLDRIENECSERRKECAGRWVAKQ